MTKTNGARKSWRNGRLAGQHISAVGRWNHPRKLRLNFPKQKNPRILNGKSDVTKSRNFRNAIGLHPESYQCQFCSMATTNSHGSKTGGKSACKTRLAHKARGTHFATQ